MSENTNKLKWELYFSFCASRDLKPSHYSTLKKFMTFYSDLLIILNRG